MSAELVRLLPQDRYGESQRTGTFSLLGHAEVPPQHSRYSEVYLAYSRTARRDVAVKIARNGGVGESEAVAGLRLSSIPRPEPSLECTVDGVLYGITSRPYYQNHIGLHEADAVREKTFRAAAIAAAKDLIVIRNTGLVLGDIKPKNILIEPDGSNILFIDQTAHRFGERLEALTRDYAHPSGVAGLHTDAWSYLHTITWRAERSGFSGMEHYARLIEARALAQTHPNETPSLEHVIAVLEEPGRRAQKRGRIAFTGAALVAALAFGYAREHHQQSQIAALESAALASALHEPTSSHAIAGLGAALARRTVFLARAGAFGDTSGTQVAAIDDSLGKPVYQRIGFPEASGLITMLAAAARVDSTALSLAKGYAHDLVREAQEHRLRGEMQGADVTALLPLSRLTGDTTLLFALVAKADLAIGNAVSYPRGTIYPFWRDNPNIRPWAVVYDAQSCDVIRAGGAAARMLGSNTDRFHTAFADCITTARRLLASPEIGAYEYASLEGERGGSRHAEAQAHFASVLWEGGATFENAAWKAEALRLLEPFKDSLVAMTRDNDVPDVLAGLYAYRVLSQALPQDSTAALRRALLRGVVRDGERWGGISLPKIRRGIWNIAVERERKIIGGVCSAYRPIPCRSGTRLADALLLEALLTPPAH